MKVLKQEKKGGGLNLVEKIQRIVKQERETHVKDINQSDYIFELHAPN